MDQYKSWTELEMACNVYHGETTIANAFKALRREGLIQVNLT